MMQFAGLVVAASMVVGQSEQPEEVKALGWLVGDWAAPIPVMEEIPGLAKPGEKATFHMSFSPILDGIKMEWLLSMEVKGKTVYKAKAIIGLDKEGKFGHWFFDHKGYVNTSKWSHNGNKWSLESYQSTWVIERLDEATFTIKRTHSEGQEIPNPRVDTYKKDTAK